ncbi:MAG: recombinase family protein, partial [Actinomycetota bacterium]
MTTDLGLRRAVKTTDLVPRRAVIYLRVSTEQQTKRAGTDEGYSIEYQRDVCRRKAQGLGAVVVDEFVDAGESAKTADRPALQAMLERVEREHDVDYVIVHKLDRLSRNRLDDAMISVQIEAAKAQLVSVVENIDETPAGVLMHGLLAAFNEYQIRNHATEVMKGSVKKAEGGGTPFLAPIGYLNKRDFSDGKDARWVEPDPERAPLITWAFDAYASGEYSLRRLLDELTGKGLTNRPTGKRPARPLKLSKLAETLRNKYYIGTVVFRSVEYEGKHEPLVERHVFDRVQEVFQMHDLAGERVRSHRHYLKGSLFCARCEERLGFGFFKGRHGGLYPYFFCYGRHRGNGCDLPFLPADDVEDRVVDHYAIIQLDQELVEETKSQLRERLERQRKLALRTVKRQEARLSRLSHERIKLLHAYYNGLLPDDDLF